MNNEYFTIFPTDDKIIEFMSNCTGHMWRVEQYDFCYDLFHAHSVLQDYHYQTSFGNMDEVLQYIREHDLFQMGGRKRRRSVKYALSYGK